MGSTRIVGENPETILLGFCTILRNYKLVVGNRTSEPGVVVGMEQHLYALPLVGLVKIWISEISTNQQPALDTFHSESYKPIPRRMHLQIPRCAHTLIVSVLDLSPIGNNVQAIGWLVILAQIMR